MKGTMMEIGKRIKEMRETCGYNQNQIANFLSVDQSLISKIESGERTISTEMINQLSSLFCVPVQVFFTDEKITPSYKIAFRTKVVSNEDLVGLSVINKLVLNQLKMDELARGNEHD